VTPQRVRRIAILSPGDRALRETATGAEGRFADLFAALAAAGHSVQPAIYHDDFRDEVQNQLLEVDLVLVWVNPIHEGRTRHILDDLLREVASAGVMVSCHPDVILKLGTKEVLYDTRDLGWGCDTQLYRSPAELRAGLEATLASGSRVLKQHRGSSGAGVWRVDAVDADAIPLTPQSLVRVRHAARGSTDQEMTLDALVDQCTPYVAGDGGLIVDQQFQDRLPEGMIRCYLVRDQVAGFGHQATNALISARPGEEPPTPSQRFYHPPTLADFQPLKTKLEREWVPALMRLFDLERDQLPLLWDCDFLLGPPDENGQDTYVICEINVSSVAPYPESAVAYIVDEV